MEKDFIIRKRESKNMTQNELAEIIGVKIKTLKKWEANQSFPNVDNYCKLINILGFSKLEAIQYFDICHDFEEWKRKKGLT